MYAISQVLYHLHNLYTIDRSPESGHIEHCIEYQDNNLTTLLRESFTNRSPRG